MVHCLRFLNSEDEHAVIDKASDCYKGLRL